MRVAWFLWLKKSDWKSWEAYTIFGSLKNHIEIVGGATIDLCNWKAQKSTEWHDFYVSGVYKLWNYATVEALWNCGRVGEREKETWILLEHNVLHQLDMFEYIATNLNINVIFFYTLGSVYNAPGTFVDHWWSKFL